MSTHPLSTARLLERAATASTEPDHHHVEAAYQAAQALAMFPDPLDMTEELENQAADVAALRMALAACSTLARRIYDHPANGAPEALADFLYRILAHYVGDFETIMADLEQLADDDTIPLPTYRSLAADLIG